MTPLEGQTLSHYEIRERVGGGGMGVVYRAHDTRLKRTVALKVLPPELTRDDDAKQRFMQEAQAASALDHPNICTIYEIDETPDGRIFLAMAYYDGETVKKKIERGPLTVDDALDIAIQILQGLVEANGAGIVHRDIKPANVMVGRGGLVKIVDFGLAKLAGQSGLTRTGTTLGTVAYMSPKQTHGQLVDHRTDIWSLGVVLYEMLTGRLPFKGEQAGAISYAIVHETPPPVSALRTGVPLEFERIVNRALSKRPDDRYQTAADMLSELRLLKRASESVVQLTGTQPIAPRDVRLWPVLGALTVLVLVGGLVAYLMRPRESDVPRLINPIQVTSAIGVEDYPSWSPDGRAVAYHSSQMGNNDIWIAQIGGQAVNRTADYLGDDVYPSWSPDGRQIAFWSARDGGGYFVMSALGGAPRRILARPGAVNAVSRPQWSSDSTTLACVVDRDDESGIDLVSIRSGESRRVRLPARRILRYDLSWSPDGKFFAYIDDTSISGQVRQLSVVRERDGKVSAITDGRTNVRSPSWSPDARTLYYVSNRIGSMDLWQQRIGDDGSAVGPAQAVTTGVGMLSATLSADGSKLAYSRGRWVSNVWSIPILSDRSATWTDARQLTFDEAFAEYLGVSPDGQRLVVSSDKAGNPDLWLLPALGGEMQQLTTDPTPDWFPRFSPDGRSIVFYSYRSGHRDIWVMPVEGGPARQITSGDNDNYTPGWSPDGREIVFHSDRGGKLNIWVISADGGSPRRLTDGRFDARPSWSPDGKWIAFDSVRGGSAGQLVWRVSERGGVAAQLTKGPGRLPVWSPDGKLVYFLGGARFANLWSVSPETGVERQVTDFSGKRGTLSPGALATDGRQLFFSWRNDTGDIWAMDVARGLR